LPGNVSLFAEIKGFYSAEIDEGKTTFERLPKRISFGFGRGMNKSI
jgi:hypothetical protein